MSFARWLEFMWQDHCEEVEGWTHQLPHYSSKDYYNKYKWWLRREYRHRRDNGLL